MIRPDVRVAGYLGGECPNCGRERLELYVDGEEERAVGVGCEKCSIQWLLDPALAEYHSEHSDSNPLKPINDPPAFGESEVSVRTKRPKGSN